MQRILDHLKHNLVAYLALFVALGGTSYAAIRLPTGSVGTRALANHSITPIKLGRGSIAGYVRDWVTITPEGNIAASRPRAHLLDWEERPGPPPPGGFVFWSDRAPPASCFRIATTFGVALAPAYASATPASSRTASAFVQLSAPQTGVNVAVICPQP